MQQEPIYGFNFKRTEVEKAESFAPKNFDDGALTLSPSPMGTFVDLDGSVRTETELINRYRDMSMQPEIDTAINEITNEAVVIEDNVEIVKLNLDNVDIPAARKKTIQDEFKEILRLFDFNKKAYDLFRRWYIDGRMYFHVITYDEKSQSKGIMEMRYIDPRKLRKIRIVEKRAIKGQQTLTIAGGASLQKVKEEYFVYNEKGFGAVKTLQADNNQVSGLKIGKDSIVDIQSGLVDTSGNMVLSYLHKAIKPLNMLRIMEDASLIYQLARAPERRIWYIDIGDLPKAKAEQYLREQAIKHKNRIVYDSITGNVRDDRKFMTMLEDYWVPRTAAGKTTEVQTLPAGNMQGQLDLVEYFLRLLYRSLNVPITRLNSENAYTMGRATEITRDESNFKKFIRRLQSKFGELFTETLEKQLILKGITNKEDWQNVFLYNIKYLWNEDNYWSEAKEADVISNRLQLLQLIEPYVGKYVSNEYVRKVILRQRDEDIERIDAEIASEHDNVQYNEPDMSPDDEMEMGKQMIKKYPHIAPGYGKPAPKPASTSKKDKK